MNIVIKTKNNKSVKKPNQKRSLAQQQQQHDQTNETRQLRDEMPTVTNSTLRHIARASSAVIQGYSYQPEDDQNQKIINIDSTKNLKKIAELQRE